MPGVPPVPIPNTAVKPRAADGSWTLGPARVGCRQVFGPDVVKATSGPSFCPDTKDWEDPYLSYFAAAASAQRMPSKAALTIPPA